MYRADVPNALGLPESVYQPSVPIDRWLLTPFESFIHWQPVRTEHSSDTGVEVLPFKLPKRELDGTPYLYQLAVSTTSIAPDIVAVRDVCDSSVLVDDHRSGVIVFHGTLIVSSYSIPGRVIGDLHNIAVHPNYRGQGLSVRTLEQWLRETPYSADWPTQEINIGAAKAFLAAYHAMIHWALRNGKPVPERVLDTYESELKALRQRVQKVQDLHVST